MILVIAVALFTNKPWTPAIGVAFAAFICEYVDSTLGMGYGTTLASILIV